MGYILVYERKIEGEAPLDIDIEGREGGHSTRERRAALLGLVRGFGRPELTYLTGQLMELPHDGRRRRLLPHFCGRACVKNAYLAQAIAMLEREVGECGKGS